MFDFDKFSETWSESSRNAGRIMFSSCISAAVDEDVALLAGMIAGGKVKEAGMRSKIVTNGTLCLAQATKIVASLNFAQGNTLDAEIFAVGTWNKVWKFSLKDLKDIAANFSALSENHKVPLKLGHNDQQPFTDGQPALGWVTKVWVEGEKLMARFENVPNVIKQAFSQKMYRHVSVELDIDVEHKGKKYKYVLSAVALLGADTPAVNTLADLSTYLDGGERLAASRREVFSAVSGSREVSTEGDKEMTEEQMNTAIAKAVADQTAQFAKTSEESAKVKAENEALKASLLKRDGEDKAAKVKMHRESLTAKLEQAVKNKVFTPAQRESAIKFMKMNEDSVLDLTADTVDEYIKINGGKVRMSNEQGHQTQQQSSGTSQDAGAELTAIAKKLQAENAHLTFATARNRAMEGNPELARAWLNDGSVFAD